jgi:hypothetical protein
VPRPPSHPPVILTCLLSCAGGQDGAADGLKTGEATADPRDTIVGIDRSDDSIFGGGWADDEIVDPHPSGWDYLIH